MLVVAFLGAVLPNHPFDYIYNYVLSNWIDKPKVPARSAQLKFTCTIATLWLTGVVYLMSSGLTSAGLIMAGVLAGMAILPSTLDLCLPSKIYNALFLRKNKNSQTV